MIAAATCLALAVYHEDRSGGVEGMRAVAEVVLNRKFDDRWPDTICEVVYQEGQFSFTFDGTDLEMREPDSRALAVEIAEKYLAMSRLRRNTATTGFADHFHAESMERFPNWTRWDRTRETARVGGHVFYKITPVRAEPEEKD